MDLDEAIEEARDWYGSDATRDALLDAVGDYALEIVELRARIAAIDRRADQIEGGLKPYARPPEIARYVTGRET